MAGRSVHAYLKSVRLEAAASMLEAGYCVTEAALATGFANLSHFSAAGPRGGQASAWGRLLWPGRSSC